MPHPKAETFLTQVWVCEQARGGWRPALTCLWVQGPGGERDQHADRKHTFQLKTSPRSRHSLRKSRVAEQRCGSLPFRHLFLQPNLRVSKLRPSQGCQAARFSPCPGAMPTINLDICRVHTLVRVTGTNSRRTGREEYLAWTPLAVPAPFRGGGEGPHTSSSQQAPEAERPPPGIEKSVYKTKPRQTAAFKNSSPNK